MRKLIAILFFVSGPFFAFSQYNWDYGGSVGVSNYLGEIGGEAETRKNFIADLKFNQTKIALGGFARYKLFPFLSIKSALTYGRISGADNLSTNPGRAGRNLSFRNDLFELSATGQFFFYEINDLGGNFRYRNDFKMYVYAGAAGFFHNPKAELNGQWYALQPLKTEGQVQTYSRFGLALPVGGGFYFTFDKKYRVGWELGWRKTFTDYLDDVSTFYAEPAVLNDPIAIALANRTDEVVSDPAFAANFLPGNKRGDPKYNDSYLISTFSFSYVMRGKSSFYRSKYNHIFGGKKYKKRRTRAKF